MIKPNVKIGDTILRRDGNGGEPDTWVECKVNDTYLKLINEHPSDYKQLNGELLPMMIAGSDNNSIAEKIVQAIGKYVNGLDRRNLGVPLMDEVAVSQMEYIVQQILDSPNAEIEIPEYD